MASESIAKQITEWPVRLKNYVEELRTEMRRVTWPNFRQVRATTVVVIFTVFAFAAFFATVDFILGRSVGRIFDAFTT
jgi:preprotein translocase subunit SecE